MKPSKILREMFQVREDTGIGSAAPTAGLRVSGDEATLGALQDALQEAAASIHDNPDLSHWCERAYNAVAMGIRRRGGSVTLPPYTETPELASFNDDEGIGPDEEI